MNSHINMSVEEVHVWLYTYVPRSNLNLNFWGISGSFIKSLFMAIKDYTESWVTACVQLAWGAPTVYNIVMSLYKSNYREIETKIVVPIVTLWFGLLYFEQNND